MKIKNENIENINTLMQTAIDTATEMIIQRGYEITDIDDDKIIGINKDNKQIVIFTQQVAKFNIDRAKEYIGLLYKIGMDHCIIIYIESVTTMTKKLVENSIDVKIELFTQEELQYNITKHRLVPKHIRLSPEKATKFKALYGIKLPTLLRTDPISRFYNYQRGDIIKIIRKNSIGDETISYRIVKG